MEIRPITASNVSDLPINFFKGVNCKYCVYWERPDRFSSISAEEAWSLKREWFLTLRKELRPCGALAYIKGHVAGYIQFSLPKYLPAVKEYPIRPDPDAVFISCVAVSPKWRGIGIGSALLNFVERSITGKFKAIETLASRSSNAPSGPVGFFLRHGFEIKTDHPSFPLLRKAVTL